MSSFHVSSPDKQKKIQFNKMTH